MPAISIIIPVYNIENYIIKCVDSILNQSFSDYEIILVNDGSTDNSANICDDYARQNECVKVFHQLNSGVSAARNSGLDNATGKWIMFVDGDDSLYPNALAEASGLIDFEDDILVFNSAIECADGTKRYCYPHNPQFIGRHLNPRDLFKMYGYTRGSVWSCFFNRHLIQDNNIRFSTSMKNSEDTLFFRIAMYFASKIYFADINFYRVYERDGSASRSWTQERILKFADSLDILESEVARYGITYKDEPLFNYFTYGLISSLFNQYAHVVEDQETTKLIKHKIQYSSLYPINMDGIPVLRNKMRILNTSISLFHFLIRLKKIN